MTRADKLITELWSDLEAMAEDWEAAAKAAQSEAEAEDNHPNDRVALQDEWAIYSVAAEKLRAAMPVILPRGAVRT